MNKIAVVTGGAGGIGQAIAERFAKDKQTVVLLDMNEDTSKKPSPPSANAASSNPSCAPT